MNNVAKRNMLDLLDELRAIAQTGLNYSQDPFDIQRYTRIRDLVSKEYSIYSGISTNEIRARFSKELGYVTPKIGVQCALFNDAGEILLEKRKDDGLWGLPGGWVEVSEIPEAAIKREIAEEANLTVESLSVIGFYTRLSGQFDQPHASIHVLYLCDNWNGELKMSFESLAMEFQDPFKISHWHKDHKQQAEEAVKQYGFICNKADSLVNNHF